VFPMLLPVGLSMLQVKKIISQQGEAAG
jgi:hypothetical protein